MLKNTEKYYSPNFNKIKRSKNDIKFIIIHYTGMANELRALDRLTNIQSEVSSHYFIKENGKILELVPNLYTAWHAGKSKWGKFKNLNKNSIGIEISNPGHQLNYKNILGHSDIAPERKKDPGEKFPWEFLSKKKLCVWHKLKEKKLKKLRRLKTNKIERRKFFKNVKDIGYSSTNKMAVIQAFQRRFRQNLINGIVDQECLQISNSLL